MILKKGSTGSLVSFLQLTLNSTSFSAGNVDGIFGSKTQAAVKKFQTNNKLVVDGIVGEKTWNALAEYMVVPTTLPYTYDILTLNIRAFLKRYPFISSGNIGTSTMGNPIPYIKIGTGNKKLLYLASTHANEWICSPVIMKFIEDYSIAINSGNNIYNISASDLFNQSTIYFVPMLNPDGVNLVTNSLNKNSKEYVNAKKIANKFPNIRFPDGWKANIIGIDLNLQFPAGWDKAKEIKYSQGYTTYAPRDFVGKYPLQAFEAMAIYDFTLENNFDLILTYHSQGEVIYWQYLDYLPPQALEIGQKFSNTSGYTLAQTPYASSFAGFKDWYIMHYNRPGYTIEVGRGTNPLPLSQFNKIYADNLSILALAPTYIQK